MSVYSNLWNDTAAGRQAYIEGVLALVGDRDPHEILSSTVDAVKSAAKNFDAAALRRPEGPGKWSAIEVIQHLADSELVWAFRLRLVIAQNEPELTGYDQDAWASALRYSEADFDRSLEQLQTLREANLHLLESLTADELARIGRQGERGVESVEHMVVLYAGHDVVHLRQLERILGVDAS